jgi:N6-L-threonylcarbamoyladenine synthase
MIFNRRYGKPAALVAAGGVAANEMIRQVLDMVAREASVRLVVPPPELCTDNGAMIAWAGAERLELGLTDGLDVSPRARWPLAEVVHAVPAPKFAPSSRLRHTPDK